MAMSIHNTIKDTIYHQIWQVSIIFKKNGNK